MGIKKPRFDDFGTNIPSNQKATLDTPEEGRILPQEAAESKCSETDVLKRSQWAVVGPSEYMACAKTVYPLPPGIYSFNETHRGIVVVEHPLNTDDLIEFPEKDYQNVLEEVEKFWKIGDQFKKYGYLHRRGVLLYGDAGGGKSCLVKQICKNVIDKKGIVFLCEIPKLALYGLTEYRKVEPDRSVVCVFEDIDAIVERRGESELLSLLDGENQLDKVINLATTNYPERLDRRIVSRPRRFDRVLYIGMPTEDVRRVYFEKKLKLEKEEVDKWVKLSKGLSFAALAEMVISSKCLGNSLEKTVQFLNEMKEKKISSNSYDKSNFGFANKQPEGEPYK